MKDFNSFLDFQVVQFSGHELRMYNILLGILILVLTKLLLWIIHKAIYRTRHEEHFESSRAYSLYQIIRYFLWTIAITIILENFGIKITVFIAGSAALLVGLGLGLQQTLNDFLSGIILLVEGTTKINDVLEIDGDIIMLQEIGLRTSKGLNRDDISVILPNSKITTNKVINWSHQSEKTRFRINVGVAYGSDVELVSKLLTESALTHPDITDKDHVEVRLTDFGSSSLDFQLLFFSNNVFRIERVKSDIRKIINQKFSENNIIIPFSQLDLYIKNDKIVVNRNPDGATQ